MGNVIASGDGFTEGDEICVNGTYNLRKKRDSLKEIVKINGAPIFTNGFCLLEKTNNDEWCITNYNSPKKDDNNCIAIARCKDDCLNPPTKDWNYVGFDVSHSKKPPLFVSEETMGNFLVNILQKSFPLMW